MHSHLHCSLQACFWNGSGTRKKSQTIREIPKKNQAGEAKEERRREDAGSPQCSRESENSLFPRLLLSRFTSSQRSAAEKFSARKSSSSLPLREIVREFDCNSLAGNYSIYWNVCSNSAACRPREVARLSWWDQDTHRNSAMLSRRRNRATSSSSMGSARSGNRGWSCTRCWRRHHGRSRNAWHAASWWTTPVALVRLARLAGWQTFRHPVISEDFIGETAAIRSCRNLVFV